jgi:hypothetical protein
MLDVKSDPSVTSIPKYREKAFSHRATDLIDNHDHFYILLSISLSLYHAHATEEYLVLSNPIT